MQKTPFDRLRTFLGDARGAITVEFVVTLPILLAALGFAEQYGHAMRVRNSMDVAARDAARFLSRAPIDETTGQVPDVFVCTAEAIITTRLGDSVVLASGERQNFTAIGCSGFYTDNTTRQVAYEVNGEPVTDSIAIIADENGTQVTIQAYVDFPFLEWINYRETDVEFTTTDDGQESYRYVEQQEKSFSEFLRMTVQENWPRTQ